MLFREEDEDLEALPFDDRDEAGRILAGKLSAYADRSDVIVLGLLRGGVPVASAVAGALHLPLEVLAVIKLGSPWGSELAMGALAEGRVHVLDLSLVQAMCVSKRDIDEVVAAAREELATHERLYRGGRLPQEVEGKTVILVDDGIATGCSVLAAIAAVRYRGAACVVVAVPVAPASGCNAVRMEADEFISVAEPEMFVAVSQWYRDFSPVNDEEVCHLLGIPVGSTPRAA